MHGRIKLLKREATWKNLSSATPLLYSPILRLATTYRMVCLRVDTNNLHFLHLLLFGGDMHVSRILQCCVSPEQHCARGASRLCRHTIMPAMMLVILLGATVSESSL